MIFYFMKYKSLEKHYRQMGDQNHEEDEMKDIYHEDLQGGNVLRYLTIFVLDGKRV